MKKGQFFHILRPDMVIYKARAPNLGEDFLQEMRADFALKMAQAGTL